MFINNIIIWYVGGSHWADYWPLLYIMANTRYWNLISEVCKVSVYRKKKSNVRLYHDIWVKTSNDQNILIWPFYLDRILKIMITTSTLLNPWSTHCVPTRIYDTRVQSIALLIYQVMHEKLIPNYTFIRNTKQPKSDILF